MAQARLTYCGNVHPAADPEAWIAAAAGTAVPVARAIRAAGRSFGLGGWWNAATAATLAHSDEVRERLGAFLAAHDLPIWTLNAFPHGAFHGARVKTAVYRPDWAEEERLVYTRNVAGAAAALAKPGATIPVSTLPLGYREPGEPADLRRMARNLARAASALAALEERTAVRIVLALEPEPFCLLERAAEAADFLESWLFDDGAWTVPEAVLRRHLGVCVDLCHLAVVGEDPLPALADLRQRSIAVPKIQVVLSELRDPEALDELLAFDEAVYLHQTVALDGRRALDLGEVRQRRAEFAAAGRLRTHFHMPIYWDRDGALGSTRAEVVRVLAGLTGDDLPLLEVETYTWSVLAGFERDGPLATRLLAELEFADKHLGR